MKKIVIGLVVLTMLSLVACTNKDSDELTETDNLNSIIMDIFQHHHSVALFQFGSIVDSLSKIKNSNDINYVKGKVDLYLSGNPSFIPVAIASEKEIFNQIVQPELQEELLSLYSNQKKYIEDIKP